MSNRYLARFWVRFFDICFSLIAIIALLPLFLICAVLLRFTGEGEIFYSQVRVGRNRKNFSMLKFATMLKDSPNMVGGTITVAGDSRVLPVGKFLRKTKINELPQLWNVLVGDMSLVGPRPITSDTFGYYTPNGQSVISIVRPGITGVSSIIFRSEEDMVNIGADPREFYKQRISPYKEALELWFVDNYSLKLYFKLVAVTAVVLFSTNSRVIFSFVHGVPDVPQSLRKFLV